MASSSIPPGTSLDDVMAQLRALQQKQDELLSAVEALVPHSPTLSGHRPSPAAALRKENELENEDTAVSSAAALASKPAATPPLRPIDAGGSPLGAFSPTSSAFTSRIILT